MSGGLLWLFGGRSDPDWEHLDRVGSYDPFKGLWNLNYSPLESGRAYLAGAADQESIYALGGTDQANSYFEDAFEAADTGGSLNWSSMPSLPDERSDGTAVTYQNHIYYIGGTKTIEFDEQGEIVNVIEESNLWRYNVGSRTWATNLQNSPIGLAFISAAVVKGKIYVPGGATSANTFVYDIAGNSWSQIPAPQDMPLSIYYQCVAVGNQVWRIGGLASDVSGGSPTNQVWVLDTQKGQWSRHPSSMNIPRMSFAAGVVGTRVVAAGGIKEISLVNNKVEFVATNTTEYFELSDFDSDGIPDLVEEAGCTDPQDTDTDDDGIPDGLEDSNKNGLLDPGETDPCNADTDGDGVQDGTEMGYTLSMVGPYTDTEFFQPDLDPSTRTDPLKADTDGDGMSDGLEDSNRNGRVDAGEFDPRVRSISFVAPGFACGAMTPCFAKIQDAINASNTHVIIKIREGFFNENISLQQGKEVSLSGGYNSGFSSNTGFSAIPYLVSSGGLAGFERMVIGPPPR